MVLDSALHRVGIGVLSHSELVNYLWLQMDAVHLVDEPVETFRLEEVLHVGRTYERLA